MPDFMAKMHQILFRLGLCVRPRWGAYSAPPDTLAGFKGPTSKGRGGQGREKEGSGREGGEVREGEGRRGEWTLDLSASLFFTVLATGL